MQGFLSSGLLNFFCRRWLESNGCCFVLQVSCDPGAGEHQTPEPLRHPLRDTRRYLTSYAYLRWWARGLMGGAGPVVKVQVEQVRKGPLSLTSHLDDTGH